MPSGHSPFLPGITVWRQIADDLLARMDQGEIAVGQRLPNETELAQSYGVNRHTMRRALQELAALGRLQIRHGRGTFVAEPVFDYHFLERPRFSEWVKKYQKPGSNQILAATLLSLEDLPELPRIRQYDVFPDHPQVAMIKTLGLVGDDPISIARHVFFGEALLPLVDDLQQGLGITQALHQRGIADYTRLRSTISTTLPAPEDRRLLSMHPGESIFVCENVNVDSHGVGIEFSTVLYPGSRVRLVYEPG